VIERPFLFGEEFLHVDHRANLACTAVSPRPDPPLWIDAASARRGVVDGQSSWLRAAIGFEMRCGEVVDSYVRTW
jgi:hypothetical protein